MFKYLVKNNETDKRFECEAENFEELKEKCKLTLGTSDILIIKKEEVLLTDKEMEEWLFSDMEEIIDMC